MGDVRQIIRGEELANPARKVQPRLHSRLQGVGGEGGFPSPSWIQGAKARKRGIKQGWESHCLGLAVCGARVEGKGPKFGEKEGLRGIYLHLGFEAQRPASQGGPCPFPSHLELGSPCAPLSQLSRTLGSLYLSRKWDLTVALSALRWANWASLSILRSTRGTYQQPVPPIPGFALPPNLSSPHFLRKLPLSQFPPPGAAWKEKTIPSPGRGRGLRD